MTVKTTGRDFKKFLSDTEFWPEDAYYDDDLIIVNGEEKEYFNSDEAPDDAVIKIEAGVVFFPDGRDVSLATHFKKWKKKQTVLTVLVEVDSAKLDEVVKAITNAGGKVIK